MADFVNDGASPDGAVVYTATTWKTNGHLIEAAAWLGYLRKDWRTLDPTYGSGGFWTQWIPDRLVIHDLAQTGVDFTALPYGDHEFDAVVFDPPYKLNGSPTPAVDGRYGVNAVATRVNRSELMRNGLGECVRVASVGAFILVKCMDQVAGGKKHWQTLEMANEGVRLGCDLVDRFDLLRPGRAQPPGRRQVHTRANYSTLLVFQKERF